MLNTHHQTEHHHANYNLVDATSPTKETTTPNHEQNIESEPANQSPLRHSTASLQQVRSDLASLHAALRNKDASNLELRDENTALRDKLVDALARAESAEARLIATQQSGEVLRHTSQIVEAQSGERARQCDELRSECDTLTKRLQLAEANLVAMASEKMFVEDRLEQSERVCAELQLLVDDATAAREQQKQEKHEQSEEDAQEEKKNQKKEKEENEKQQREGEEDDEEAELDAVAQREQLAQLKMETTIQQCQIETLKDELESVKRLSQLSLAATSASIDVTDDGGEKAGSVVNDDVIAVVATEKEAAEEAEREAAREREAELQRQRERDMEELEAQKTAIEALSKQMEEIRAERDELETRLADKTRKLSNLMGEAEQRAQHSQTEHRKAAAALEQRISELQDELQASQSEAAQLNTHNCTLEQTLNSKTKELQRITDELHELRDTSTLNRARCTEIEAELEQTVAQLATHKNELRLARETNAELQSSVAGLTAEAEAERRRATQLQEEVCGAETRLHTQLERHAEQLRTHAHATSQAEAQRDAIRQQLGSVEEERDQLAAGQSALSSRVEAAHTQLAELRTQLSEEVARKQSLIEKTIKLEDELAQCRRSLERKRRDFDEIHGAVMELGRENQSLQLEHERLTTRHWMSDSDAESCGHCQRAFSVTVRRHHCRSCGQVFCHECSGKTAPMPNSSTPQRVCDACYSDVMRARHQPVYSQSSSQPAATSASAQSHNSSGSSSASPSNKASHKRH